MKYLLIALLLAATDLLHAQSRPADAVVIQNDSIILEQIIKPFIIQADQNSIMPDWESLKTTIRTKYDTTYVDRTVTKAQIYYYYGKDWPVFSKAIVHFTVDYENKEDLRLMNKNAKMILKYSKDPEDWKTALTWVKHAVDKEPSNAAYKETFDALSEKIKTQGYLMNGQR